MFIVLIRHEHLVAVESLSEIQSRLFIGSWRFRSIFEQKLHQKNTILAPNGFPLPVRLNIFDEISTADKIIWNRMKIYQIKKSVCWKFQTFPSV